MTPALWPEPSCTIPLTFENVGRDTVLAGVTISDFINLCIPSVSSDGGSDPAATNPPLFSDCDGYNGNSIYGGGITIGQFSQINAMFPGLSVNVASPTIINCVIRNIQIWAGDGGDGVTGPACSALGDGGWGGKAYGGGVYIGPYCKPLFKNVTIRDCNAIGGDGGNPGVLEGAVGYVGSWGDPTGATNNWFFGPYDEVWQYSGHGGGAYCDVNSTPEFIDCNFLNNTAQGGSSGIAPGFFHSRIDSYGAAVYCAAARFAKIYKLQVCR